MPNPRSPRGLTAEHHNAIRRSLALIPVVVWLAYVWPVFFTQWPDASDPGRGHYVRDFLHFYAQGTVALERDRAALYDIDAMAAVAERAAPKVPKHLYPPVYGPQVGFLFAPFATVPYVTALKAWLLLTIAGYAGCVYAVAREQVSLQGMPGTVATLALGFAGLHFALSFGQASVVGLICFTVLWVALRRGSLFTAGLAVGALAYKPTLALVAALVFAARREWRIVVGAGAAVGVQVLISALYWGPGVFAEYGAALLRLPNYIDAMEPQPELAQSIRGTFSAVGLSLGVGAFATVTASMMIAVLAAWCWRPNRSLELSYISIVCASLLVDPHFYAYDLLVAAPALMLALYEADEHQRPSLGIGALAVYAAPLISIAGIAPRMPWILLALALLLTVTAVAQAPADSTKPFRPKWLSDM